MTPEELQIIAQLVSGGKTLSDFQDKPAAPAAPPPDLAAPYNAQATKYNTQADSVEKDMATPYPEPHGVKENIVAGIRSGMQDFGRLGVPGGSTGQEALRRKQFDDQNAQRLDRVKSLRSGAQAQQDLGQRATYQASEVANQAGNLKVNQDELALRQKIANRPVRVNETTGSMSQAVNPDTQMPLEGTQVKGPDRPDTYKNYPYRDSVAENGHTIRTYFDHSPDNIIANEDLGIKASGGGAGGGFQMAPYTNAQGDAAIGGYDKKGNTITPATIKGDPTKAPVKTAAEGNQSAVQTGKEQAAFKDASASYQALVGLRDKSGSDPQSAYVNDQGMVDQFFNIVKPTSGARMNGAYIAQLLHPGPLKNKAEVMYQKLTSGAKLTQEDRVWMVEAAKVVLDAKGSVLARGGSPAASAAGGFVKPGGALESLLKGGQ